MSFLDEKQLRKAMPIFKAAILRGVVSREGLN
jgi:hypothetical protein